MGVAFKESESNSGCNKNGLIFKFFDVGSLSYADMIQALEISGREKEGIYDIKLYTTQNTDTTFFDVMRNIAVYTIFR